MTDHRDLIEILRSTGQRVTGAADLILQATQPGATITDTALDALESAIRVQTDHSRWETGSAEKAIAQERRLSARRCSSPPWPADHEDRDPRARCDHHDNVESSN
ncbi:hypothetical protein [Tessaracoccus sp. Z1128]